MESEHWFFATDLVPLMKYGTPSLPRLPCNHQHKTLEEAKACARRRGSTHVREVRGVDSSGAGIGREDHKVCFNQLAKENRDVGNK